MVLFISTFKNMKKEELFLRFQNEAIINSHSHHLPDSDHYSLNLENLFKNSYVNWCAKPIPTVGAKDEISSFLNAVRNRSYFVWLEKSLMNLYDIDEHIDVDNWEVYDNAIRKAHKDTNWHHKILREKCNYKAVLLDAFWKPGDNNKHPNFFRPAYRINSIFYGFNSKSQDHNGNNFQLQHNQSITDISEYIEFVYNIIREKKQEGCTVLKCALAYDRSLKFEAGTKEAAQKAMKENPSEDDIRSFQNYVFDEICKIAAELSMPVQIHTGLGLMAASNAMQLQSLISRNPKTMFWLMHGSYPWTNDIAGLTHAYPNVWADLCWLPLISSVAAQGLLHQLIDVCNLDRVVWGCDTWTSEESYGAKLAFLDLLSKVLSERIKAGMMRECDAIRYGEAIMQGNAASIL